MHNYWEQTAAENGKFPLRAVHIEIHAVNAIFLKHSKEGRLSSSHVGVRNIPSDVCYNNTKH